MLMSCRRGWAKLGDNYCFFQTHLNLLYMLVLTVLLITILYYRERLIRKYTKFDFTVDEGKKRLNPSREKNKYKYRRRKVEKSCVTPAGTSTSLTSRINGMTTHTHTHTACAQDKLVSLIPTFCNYKSQRAPD